MRIARILAAALQAVDPGALVDHYLAANRLPRAGRIFALGLGKAAIAMTQALSRCTNLTEVLIITKHASPLDLQSATIMEAGHPVPDSRSLAAGKKALEFVSNLQADDLLICLISGGGSSLMSAPFVPLEVLQHLTSGLLASGVRIDEINTLRRHLDQIKGGGLAKATKAKVLSLILSDVVGKSLEAIASGPTAPDPSTRQDALRVLEKYGLLTNTPESVVSLLQASPETPKPNDPIFKRVENVIVGDNDLAIQAALAQAGKEGFKAESLGSNWQGEAREVGAQLADKLRVAKNTENSPFCFIAGGETTVTLRQRSGQAVQGAGNPAPLERGKGGRNQELALAAVAPLAGLPNTILISLATDGEDGPTDAAGAVVTGETLQRAQKLGLDVTEHLSGNNAYPFFDKLGDLLKTGPTGTNVNDLVFLFSL